MTEYQIQSHEGLNFVEHVIDLDFGHGKTLELKTGKLAKQAAGAVMAKCGETCAFVAVVMSDEPSDRDFFPLMVDYREKFYAGGRIPGGFFKREARPSDGETLRARVIDRTLRPMFPEGFKHEVQVYITIVATDKNNPAELVAMCAASAALHISRVPLVKPVAGVRVGMSADGRMIINPNSDEIDASPLDLIVAGHADGINMVECGANEVSEESLVEALELGHEQIKKIVSGIEALRKVAGKPKFEYVVPEIDAEIKSAVNELWPPYVQQIRDAHGKEDRYAAVDKAVAEITEQLIERFPEQEGVISKIVQDLDDQQMRENLLKNKKRADGRGPTEVRPIWCETDVLPQVHGSSVFTRGQTQALAVVTLGSVSDKQMIDDMTGVSYKGFLLHYNFPSYSVGECRMPRGPGRREIGHGALAERAVLPVLPGQEQFPYTIRSVVEILESNGSSSMATVCSTSMALMDAGVPIKSAVAGIAMGLITGANGEFEVLTDIAGIEDHSGDMDFKVAGTNHGVTALQMDIKVEGITRQVLARALEQAKSARQFILSKMDEAITGAREELKPHAPRIVIIPLPPEKIREVIGTGGKVIRDIIERSGAQIDIEDDGNAYVMASDKESMDMATGMIYSIIKEVEIGEIFEGKVVRTLDSGAIVEFAPNKDGYVHISELEHHRVANVEDVVNVGDIVKVKVIDVDRERGRIKLSRKALLEAPEGGAGGGGDDHGGGERRERRHDGDRDRRPRGGDREGRGGGDRDRRRRPRPDRERRDH